MNLKARVRIEGRESRLRALGYSDYGSYISSTRWATKRREYWDDPDLPKACGVCGTDEAPLPLHHRTYERVGCERLEDLVPVCPNCHALIHELERRGDIDGLDADLSLLSDPVRAMRNPAPTPIPLLPTAANLERRMKVQARLEADEASVRRQRGLKREQAERRVKRHRDQLRRLDSLPHTSRAKAA